MTDSSGSTTRDTAAAGCSLDPTCEFGPHAPDAHPCGQKPEPPGTPCRYCGKPTPLDGEPCATCWQPFDIATFKAFCAAQGWDTTVTEAVDGT